MKTPDYWLRELLKMMGEDYNKVMERNKSRPQEINQFKDYIRLIQEDARTKEK